MATYAITYNSVSKGFYETSTQTDVSTGQAFKVLTFVIGAYECDVAECTPTRVLVRTPNSDEYSHLFEGSEEEMQALVVLALHFQKVPAERDHIKGTFIRAAHTIRRMLLNEKPEPGRVKKNAQRVQDQVKLMFRLDTDTAPWTDQMRRIMAHLDAGKPIGPLR